MTSQIFTLINQIKNDQLRCRINLLSTETKTDYI